jgi:uncharacterized protein YndB with AHSA1/START domain
MTESGVLVEPVHKTLHVRCSRERAFEVFTREIGSWWPVGRYSIGEGTVEEVIFEEHADGRVYERNTDGAEKDWGRVLAWDPPSSFTMAWSPGSDPEKPTRLEVRFEADGDGTRVDLTHSGWEILAEGAQESRDNYNGGWDTVLGFYTRVFE